MEQKIEHVTFTSEGLMLEGMLSAPAAGAAMSAGVVVCHPHPEYGGDMDNNVVLGIVNVLQETDSAVLRFNFRGVNASEGIHDGGRGEIHDVLAALDFLEKQPIVDKSRIFLVGYSFGAHVGLRAILQSGKAKAAVAVAPPLSMYNFEFLTALSIPLLVICGDRDQFCSLAELKCLYDTITAPKKAVVLRGMDHFFWENDTLPGQAVKDFLCSYLGMDSGMESIGS